MFVIDDGCLSRETGLAGAHSRSVLIRRRPYMGTAQKISSISQVSFGWCTCSARRLQRCRMVIVFDPVQLGLGFVYARRPGFGLFTKSIAGSDVALLRFLFDWGRSNCRFA